MMPLSRCHVPKIARRAALDHMNGYDLENQSCRSTTALIGTGISELSLLNTNRNVCSVATANLQRICLSTSVHSAHRRSMRRWMLDGSGARIWSTSLTEKSMRESLPGRSRRDAKGSKVWLFNVIGPI